MSICLFERWGDSSRKTDFSHSFSITHQEDAENGVFPLNI